MLKLMANHKKYFILSDQGVYAKNDKGNTLWVESFADAYCYKNLHDAKAQTEFLKNKFPDLDVYLIGEMPEFSNGGYTRPSYDMETTGDYVFQTNRGRFLVTSYLFERQNDTEDALEIQDNLRGILGSIIIKNSAWKNLASGKSVKARSSKGNLFGTLSKVNEKNVPDNKKFAEGGMTEKDFVKKNSFQIGNTKISLEKPNGKYYRVNYYDATTGEKLGAYGSPYLYDVVQNINQFQTTPDKYKKFKTGGDIRNYDWYQAFNNISPKDETFLNAVHHTLVSGMFLIQDRVLTEEQAIKYIDQHFNQLLSNGRKGYSPIQALEMIESNKFMAGGRAWKKTRRTIAPSIAINIDAKAVEKFLKKYPKVKESMSPYIYGNDVLKNYRRWLKHTDDSELGGKAETIKSQSFGTKTFYKFDWTGVSGWASVFQYLFENKKR